MDRKRTSMTLTGVVGLVLCAWLSPVLLLVLLSLHSTGAVVASDPVELIASAPTFGNYRYVVQEGGLGIAVANSVILAVVATGVCIAVTLPAAYYSAIIARDVRPRAFFMWLLSTRMILPAATLVPFLVIADTLLLNRSIIGVAVILGALQVPVAAWLFRQSLLEVPASLCEALRLDGASERKVFRIVVLPLAWQGLLAATMIVFVFAWNEYLVSSALIADPKLKTLPLLTADFVTGYQIEWGPMLACAVIMLLPPIAAAAVMNRSTRGAFAGVHQRE